MTSPRWNRKLIDLPDDMELDYSAPAWVDWPYPMDGIHDNEQMRKSYPDGFVFTCCDTLASEKKQGCRVGKHRVADGKRMKYPGSDAETETEEEETEEDWDHHDEEEDEEEDDEDENGEDEEQEEDDEEEDGKDSGDKEEGKGPQAGKGQEDDGKGQEKA